MSQVAARPRSGLRWPQALALIACLHATFGCTASGSSAKTATGGGPRSGASGDARPADHQATSSGRPRAGAASLERGQAVWYGGKWHGRKTASGERFDQNAMTAAHKTLPFQSKVKVTNLANGKSVVVRITDRGPYGKGRIIDLAKGAAARIDMLDAGVVEVTLEVLELPPPKPPRKARGRR